jgi:hypothetical protein
MRSLNKLPLLVSFSQMLNQVAVGTIDCTKLLVVKLVCQPGSTEKNVQEPTKWKSFTSSFVQGHMDW